MSVCFLRLNYVGGSICGNNTGNSVSEAVNICYLLVLLSLIIIRRVKLCMYFLTCFIKSRSVSKAENRISFLMINKVLFYCIVNSGTKNDHGYNLVMSLTTTIRVNVSDPGTKNEHR